MAFKKVLVALDGSENSEQVLELVAGLASSLNAELLLLAVTGSHAHFERDREQEAIGDQRRAAEKYLDLKAAPLRARGLIVTEAVEPGIPADTVLAVADSTGADLIAMATHRENVLARGILGSVTDAVLRTSAVPVLAINPDSEHVSPKPNWTPSTVIVPLDGSDLAGESVAIALEIAKACDANVIFMQAVHVPSFAVAGPGAEFYGLDYGVAAQREGAHEYLQQFVEMAESEGISASSHAALGNAAARIVEESKSVPDAMIVISSHGRGGFRRMVLGGVADKIVRASHHPVLVLKHRNE